MRQARYTHGYDEPVRRSHATRTMANSLGYGQARLEAGMTVLDLGCGIGTITADIAQRVAPGRVIAVDIDAGILERARRRATERGLDNVDYQVMDAYGLDLPDASVDFAHAHQVLQHLHDPVAALIELKRVTRSGGTIAVRDGDYAAFSWYPASAGLDLWRDAYRRLARANGGEPDAGRHLLAWAHRAGLTDVETTSTSWTYAAGPSARWWGQSWADRVRHSAIATQLVDSGIASPHDLEMMAQSWLDWSEHPDAWFAVPSGEILATVP